MFGANLNEVGPIFQIQPSQINYLLFVFIKITPSVFENASLLSRPLYKAG